MFTGLPVMRKKKPIEEQINEALTHWDRDSIKAFMHDVMPLFELFNVDDRDDWVERAVGGGKENVRTVRLVRMIYLMSRIAHFHTGKLVGFRSKFPSLYQDLEKYQKDHFEQ